MLVGRKTFRTQGTAEVLGQGIWNILCSAIILEFGVELLGVELLGVELLGVERSGELGG